MIVTHTSNTYQVLKKINLQKSEWYWLKLLLHRELVDRYFTRQTEVYKSMGSIVYIAVVGRSFILENPLSNDTSSTRRELQSWLQIPEFLNLSSTYKLSLTSIRVGTIKATGYKYTDT